MYCHGIEEGSRGVVRRCAPAAPSLIGRDVFVLSYRTIQRVAAQVELEPWEMVQRLIDLGKAERSDDGSINYWPNAKRASTLALLGREGPHRFPRVLPCLAPRRAPSPAAPPAARGEEFHRFDSRRT
jgi:hypothetical protein